MHPDLFGPSAEKRHDVNDTLLSNNSKEKQRLLLKYSFTIYCEWLMLKVFRPRSKITGAEISKRTLEDTEPNRLPSNLKDGCSADVLELSKELFRVENERFVGIQDKVKSLIAICALLLPLTSALMPRFKWPELDAIPLFSFIVAILLLMDAIRVGNRAVPALDDDLLRQGEMVARGSIANSNMVATRANELATDFIVELYRAGLFALLAGLVVLVCLVTALPWIGNIPTSPAREVPPTINQSSHGNTTRITKTQILTIISPTPVLTRKFYISGH